MNVLAIDTSTEACSVALSTNGGVTERFKVAPRQHTDIIMPMIDEVLVEADLTSKQLHAVAYGAGPGSFTGIRIATAVTQGIALAHNLPVVALSTLAMMAQSLVRLNRQEITTDDTLMPTLDARQQQIYWGTYRINKTSGLVEAINGDQLNAWTDVPLAYKEGAIIFGSGIAAIDENASNEPLYPRALDGIALAENKISLGQTIDAEHAQAIYFRRGV